MRGSGSRGRRERPPEPIAEMMLAKTVLEEKNELLDAKDRMIRELRSRERRLECELQEARMELSCVGVAQERADGEAFRRGALEVMVEVVRLVADYDSAERADDRSLACRLTRLLQERYGLEVIEKDPDRIDPRIHRVIEVVRGGAGQGPALKLMSRGYRVDGRVIRPALVKAVARPGIEVGAGGS